MNMNEKAEASDCQCYGHYLKSRFSKNEILKTSTIKIRGDNNDTYLINIVYRINPSQSFSYLLFCSIKENLLRNFVKHSFFPASSFLSSYSSNNFNTTAFS